MNPVQRWEYRVTHFALSSNWDEIQASLNAAGYDGWELVSAEVERNQRIIGAPTSVTCFLKRARGA